MEKVALLILLWLLRISCVFAVITALAPFLRVGWWPIRLCDFPRMQLGAFALVVALGAIAFIAFKEWRWDHGVVLALALLVAGWQFWHVLPYTPLWALSVPAASADDTAHGRARIAILNLNFENESKRELVPILESLDADVLVLIEVNEAWIDALERVEASYPVRTGVVLEEGLGIMVWSRLPLHDAQVRHLVIDDRASIWGDLELPGGRRTQFVALHPAPPGLKTDDGDREDSRKRDAELVLAAREVADDAHDAHIIAGDFNDVAWSHTTRLFERISGLLDPRKGRSLLSTYHAEYPLLRYPIDHVFVSDGFAIASLGRVTIPGSDHLGVVVDLVLTGEYGVTPDADSGDHEEASEMVEEGNEDAREDGEG